VFSSMSLAAVIFDMDGVLIDSEPIHFEASRQLLAGYAVVHSPHVEGDLVGRTEHEVFRALKARYRLAVDEAELAAGWVTRVLALLAGPLTPMAGVPGVLHALRDAGVRLALASSSAPPIVAATLKGLGVAELFEFTVSGHEVTRGKPSPDIFLEALRRLGLPPDACLVVEDSSNGLMAAVAAGIRCVAVPCPSTSGQDFSRAAVRLASLQDLPAWMGLEPRGPRS
jgi:HAD superfamily hydrolase (TIGR01509 family)